jgi:hypothetical protein
MPHITGHDRSQTLLLPEALEDYVAPDNPVRFDLADTDGAVEILSSGLEHDRDPNPLGNDGSFASHP